LTLVGGHGRIPSGEQVMQRAVESAGSGLQEPMGSFLGPLHLLLSGSRATLLPPRPGHRERSPAPGSHRTWRAVFASLHLRCPAPRSSTGGSQHFAAIRSRFVSTVSFILSLHRGLSLPLHGARVAPERVICRQPLPPVDGSPVLRVLSAGLTSARPSNRPCLGGLSGPTGLRLNRTDLPCSRQVLRLHASGTNPGSVPAHSPYRGTEMQPSP
jgi:hypothetical protein